MDLQHKLVECGVRFERAGDLPPVEDFDPIAVRPDHQGARDKHCGDTQKQRILEKSS